MILLSSVSLTPVRNVGYHGLLAPEGTRAMDRLRLTTAIAFGTLLLLQGAALAQEPGIGSAKTARNKVEGVVGGQTQDVKTGSQVYPDETVRTGDSAVADLVFIDNTNLSVGPISEVRLDKFVYDPTGTSGRVVLQATKGAFRFVTGSQDHRAYEVRTPFGSLGVRGTVVELVIKQCVPGQPPATCGVTVKLVEGAASFTTNNGQTVDLNSANTTLSVTGSGTTSTGSQDGTILPASLASLTTGTSTASVGGVGGGGAGGGGTGGGASGGGGIAGGGFTGPLPTSVANVVQQNPPTTTFSGSSFSSSVSQNTLR
jgi:FecR protein